MIKRLTSLSLIFVSIGLVFTTGECSVCFGDRESFCIPVGPIGNEREHIRGNRGRPANWPLVRRAFTFFSSPVKTSVSLKQPKLYQRRRAGPDPGRGRHQYYSVSHNRGVGCLVKMSGGQRKVRKSRNTRGASQPGLCRCP